MEETSKLYIQNEYMHAHACVHNAFALTYLVWWCMPEIPTLRRPRQEDSECVNRGGRGEEKNLRPLDCDNRLTGQPAQGSGVSPSTSRSKT